MAALRPRLGHISTRTCGGFRACTTQWVPLAWSTWFAGHLPTVIETLFTKVEGWGIGTIRAQRELAHLPIGPLSARNWEQFRKGLQNRYCQQLLARRGSTLSKGFATARSAGTFRALGTRWLIGYIVTWAG